jgi:hypothetical protein
MRKSPILAGLQPLRHMMNELLYKKHSCSFILLLETELEGNWGVIRTPASVLLYQEKRLGCSKLKAQEEIQQGALLYHRLPMIVNIISTYRNIKAC